MATGCSSDNGHPPFASDSCVTPPCGTPNLVSGGPTGSGGASSLDGGLVTTDASVQGCFVEPTSGLVLCAKASGCDFVLDRTNFPDCGFITSSSGLDLECICQQAPATATQPTTSLGPQVCPIIAMATCAAIPNAVLTTGSETMVCNSPPTATLGTSNCRDPNSIVQSGAGGTASCPSACTQQCSGSLDPQCMTNCCATAP
ncbi:MAG TPA: hypothetical protein VHC69_30060 [Polyangiaceae bacterium]|nr:hypothetical protein [Polyangiaceae bacterium]